MFNDIDVDSSQQTLTGQRTSNIICSGQTWGFFFVFSAAKALNSSNSLSQLSTKPDQTTNEITTDLRHGGRISSCFFHSSPVNEEVKEH